MTTDYKKAKELGLIKTPEQRWENSIEHHPESEKLFEFIETHDLKDNNDYFCWKSGGDGDNGEFLMYLMDAYFELKDLVSKPKPFDPTVLGFKHKEINFGENFVYKKRGYTLSHLACNTWYLFKKEAPLFKDIKIPDHDFGLKLVSQFCRKRGK